MPEEITTILAKILHEVGENRREIGALRNELVGTRETFTHELKQLTGTQESFAQELAETRKTLGQKLADRRNILALEIINTRQALGARIDGVECKLDSFRDETLGHFDEIYKRFNRLELIKPSAPL